MMLQIERQGDYMKITIKDVKEYIKENDVVFSPMLTDAEIQKAIDYIDNHGESDTLDKWGMIDNALYDLYIRRVVND